MRRWVIALFLSFTIFPHSFAFAEGNRGISAIGVCSPHFDCDGLLRSFENAADIRVGWLNQTFSDSCECGRRILSHSKPKHVRIHLVNSTCFASRGRKCGDYEPFAGETIGSAVAKLRRHDERLLAKIDREADDVAGLLTTASGGNLTCYVSPMLEPIHFPRDVREFLLQRYQSKFPNCSMVDNAMNDECIAPYLCERHGENATADIADLDGDPLERVDAKAFAKRNENAKMVLGWTNCLNLSHGGQFKDPRERTITCNADEFHALSEFLKP